MQLLPRCAFVLGLSFGLLRAEVSVVDDLGRVVAIPSAARRVVSLAPSITETLFAMGAGNEVVGVTDFCDFPREAKGKRRVGGITNPNVETIVDLNPDLIILSMEGNVREDFDKLAGTGFPMFVTNPRTLEGIHKSIRDLGSLTGRVAAAGKLVRSMQQREESIRVLRKEQKRTMLVVSVQPLIVVGKGTFVSELLALAGGVNIAASSPSTYPTLSREAVVEANPQVVIVMSDVMNDSNELLKFFPEWANVEAFQLHNVFRIDSDIVSRPGPRAVDGITALYTIIQEGHQ